MSATIEIVNAGTGYEVGDKIKFTADDFRLLTNQKKVERNKAFGHLTLNKDIEFEVKHLVADTDNHAVGGGVIGGIVAATHEADGT